MYVCVCVWGGVLGVNRFYTFLALSCGQGTKWEYFWGLQNFKYFLGMHDMPNILRVNSRCLVKGFI